MVTSVTSGNSAAIIAALQSQTTNNTSATSGTGSASGSSTGSTASMLSANSFLTLLVAQMQNQDPLNPMDSSQMTSQLAQISTVQGIQGLQSTLSTLASNSSANEAVQSASLVGQTVMAPGSSLLLSNGQAQGALSITQPADDVTVTIKNSSGGTVKTIDLGAQAAGQIPFGWDGTTTSGSPAADGAYSFSVKATAGGQPLVTTTQMVGKVTGVENGTGGTSVMLAGLGTVNVSQITQIN